MPSIIPSFFYTFLTMALVSMLLVFSFSSYAINLQTTFEIQQLVRVLNYVAAKANELLSCVVTTNSTVRILVQLPSTIGNHQYWVRICDDSSEAWIKGALGEMWNGKPMYYLFFPKKVSTSGYYVSGYGPAVLECYTNGTVLHLNLGRGS